MCRHLLLAATVLGLVLLGQGCFRAIGEGYAAVEGASGIVRVVQPVPAAQSKPLGQYTQFEVQPFGDDTALGVPEEVNYLMPLNLQADLVKDNIPISDTSGKKLLIRGRYVYYEEAAKISVDQVFGPFEEVIARVQLVDGESGTVLGEAYCIGRSNNTSAMGAKDKAGGLAKAIAKWINEMYPNPK